ncbi:MAG: Fic family protein [Methanomassiliicoccaceae archaeon]|jgi:cell filamentation protein|nr:Fic family protein [Methanomassiliicoccaceae archaeon]
MNDYRYVDPDHVYTDPETGVLRNRLKIRDPDALMFAEAAATAKRTNELRAAPIPVTDSRALFAIHRHLFQDIYEWAGERRTVEIGKGGKQFFPTSHFDNALKYLNTLLAEYRRTDKDDMTKLADKLADILDTVNYMHPFRDGNGRTQRPLLNFEISC